MSIYTYAMIIFIFFYQYKDVFCASQLDKKISIKTWFNIHTQLEIHSVRLRWKMSSCCVVTEFHLYVFLRRAIPNE